MLLAVIMAVATIVEHAKGTPFVHAEIYGSWWFCALWAALVAVAIAYIVRSGVRRWSVWLIHASMVLMLAGALVTHLTAFQGIVYLRGDQPSNQVREMNNDSDESIRELHFYIRLDRFERFNNVGTNAAADYATSFVIMDGEKSLKGRVSMNNIYTYRGVRFYQASYDSDHAGSYLSVNCDPWGIPVTYTGYAFFFLSLLWLLVDPKGTFRRLCRQLALTDGLATVAALAIMIFASATANAQTRPTVLANCSSIIMTAFVLCRLSPSTSRKNCMDTEVMTARLPSRCSCLGYSIPMSGTTRP